MPTRDEVQPQVVSVLLAVTQKKKIAESDRLDEDLDMSSLLRRAMAVPYTNISAKYAGLAVTQSDAQGLKTVGDSIDLVTKRANRK